jgi:dsRNA-specific ribonuclease
MSGMNTLEELKKNILSVEERLGYIFENKDHLVLSLIHRSFVNEYKASLLSHNERLEFLGDSVLGLVLADYLYHRLPSYPEGLLSQLRSRLVDANSCAHYLQKLDLAPFILLGRGEKITEGRAKASIQADVFEAIIGAIYLDGGLSSVKSFFFAILKKRSMRPSARLPAIIKLICKIILSANIKKRPFIKWFKKAAPITRKFFMSWSSSMTRKLALG